MALENILGMLLKAQREHYAVGQFNINNVEWVSAILDEAEFLKSPVILGVGEGAAKYMGGWHTVVGMVKGYMEDKHISVPVALHLDHGSSYESCVAALDAGFTSVMIDGSHLPLEDNIALTKKVVDYAHPRGASVEAELGRVGGKEDNVVAESMYAVPEECLRMVEETGIDCLAPALGSVHGPYRGEPHLGFTQMEEIHQMVSLPLVLHGGSGIPDFQLKMAIDRGTCKINVNTECQQFWARIVREVLATDKDVYDPRKIIGPGKKGIQETMRIHSEIFGVIGKAK